MFHVLRLRTEKVSRERSVSMTQFRKFVLWRHGHRGRSLIQRSVPSTARRQGTGNTTPVMLKAGGGVVVGDNPCPVCFYYPQEYLNFHMAVITVSGSLACAPQAIDTSYPGIPVRHQSFVPSPFSFFLPPGSRCRVFLGPPRFLFPMTSIALLDGSVNNHFDVWCT